MSDEPTKTRPREPTERMPYPAPPPPEDRRLITTFYSFKGGVGRSMALQGAAFALAEQRQSVLMVDADIEAPGLTFAHLPQNGRGTYGFADLLGDVAELVLAPPDDRAAIERRLSEIQESLQNALHAMPGEQFQPSLPLGEEPNGERRGDDAPEADLEARLREVADVEDFKLPAPGCVFLLGAGTVVDDLAAALARLDFEALYTAGACGPGQSLLDLVGIGESPAREPLAADLLVALVRRLLMNVAAPPSGRPFDHVFIDSRTGLADTAGMCAGWLPDRLVILCGLNQQNIEGTRHVMEKLGLDADDERLLAVVASPVPNTELQLLDERLQRMRTGLGLRRPPPMLHYEPILSLLDQPLRERWHRHSRLVQGYRALARLVRDPGGDRMERLMAWMTSTVRGDDEQELKQVAAELAREALTALHRARNLAEMLLPATHQERSSAARRLPVLRVIAALLPRRLDARGLLADALSGRGLEELAEGDRALADRLLSEGLREYHAATRLDPSSDVAFTRWAIALVSMWHLSGDPAHLEAAREKALQAERIAPGQGLYNLACIDALRGDREAALDGLARALETGLIAWTHVAGDSDWDGYRDDPRYRELERAHGGDQHPATDADKG